MCLELFLKEKGGGRKGSTHLQSPSFIFYIHGFFFFPPKRERIFIRESNRRKGKLTNSMAKIGTVIRHFNQVRAHILVRIFILRYRFIYTLRKNVLFSYTEHAVLNFELVYRESRSDAIYECYSEIWRLSLGFYKIFAAKIFLSIRYFQVK